MGYVKIPTATNQPVDGRYIRLQYDRRDALNLAQILVYSREGGPNIITASTPVTQSSQHAHFSPNHIVNQRGNQWYNFAHTSGSDIPWLEVDLGAMTRIHKIVLWNRQDCCQSRILGMVLSVLNNEKEAVYLSNPIKTANQTYTWFPPNGEVLPDKDPIPNANTQGVWGNNGTTSCEQYCRGVNGNPWNNELPHSWNGAKCVGHSSNIANCHSGFRYTPGSYCICEKTGTGWDRRGWRGP